MSSPLRFFLIFFVALLAVAFARSQATGLSSDNAAQNFNGHFGWSKADKREVYGWNDCEFSPLSCLLRRRRAIPSQFGGNF